MNKELLLELKENDNEVKIYDKDGKIYFETEHNHGYNYKFTLSKFVEVMVDKKNYINKPTKDKFTKLMVKIKKELTNSTAHKKRDSHFQFYKEWMEAFIEEIEKVIKESN